MDMDPEAALALRHLDMEEQRKLEDRRQQKMKYYMDAVGTHRIDEANSELENSFLSKNDRKLSSLAGDQKGSMLGGRPILTDVDEEGTSELSH